MPAGLAGTVRYGRAQTDGDDAPQSRAHVLGIDVDGRIQE